jgi:hypothetical protein
MARPAVCARKSFRMRSSGNQEPMDLTKDVPRSPNDMLAGLVSLPRMIDKTQADAAGTLGDYDVDCPHDKPVLAFLGVDYPTFKAKLQELNFDDKAVEAWTKPLVEKHTAQEIAAFNQSRRDWAPDDHSKPYFDKLREQVAPNRTDVTTWFKLLDLDEKRAA